MFSSVISGDIFHQPFFDTFDHIIGNLPNHIKAVSQLLVRTVLAPGADIIESVLAVIDSKICSNDIGNALGDYFFRRSVHFFFCVIVAASPSVPGFVNQCTHGLHGSFDFLVQHDFEIFRVIIAVGLALDFLERNRNRTDAVYKHIKEITISIRKRIVKSPAQNRNIFSGIVTIRTSFCLLVIKYRTNMIANALNIIVTYLFCICMRRDDLNGLAAALDLAMVLGTPVGITCNVGSVAASLKHDQQSVAKAILPERCQEIRS